MYFDGCSKVSVRASDGRKFPLRVRNDATVQDIKNILEVSKRIDAVRAQPGSFARTLAHVRTVCFAAPADPRPRAPLSLTLFKSFYFLHFYFRR